jgi:hypothetical protein
VAVFAPGIQFPIRQVESLLLTSLNSLGEKLDNKQINKEIALPYVLVCMLQQRKWVRDRWVISVWGLVAGTFHI